MNGYDFAHLRGRGYEETASGVKVYCAKFTQKLVNGQDKYEFGKNLIRLDKHPVVAIAVNAPNIALQKSNVNNEVIAANERFQSTYLTLRDETDVLLDEMPLSIIQKSVDNGRPFHVNAGRINVTESSITVADAANIVANEVIELHFFYAKYAK